MKTLCTCLLIGLLLGKTYAQSFGVVGEVFPVAEKSFLVLIEERLVALKANGALDSMQQRWIQTITAHANRPTALEIERTVRTRKYVHVPEITLAQTLRDAHGRVLFAKGTRVNALKQLPSYSPCWLFFNADEEAQLHWAERQKKHCPNFKFILTGGAINQAEQRLLSTIYFDQEGRITQKLRITHVPAKVTREQNHLLIEEQAIKENGDVL